MNLLLDTHIFLWSLLAPEALHPRVVRALESPESELWLSPITTWECLVLSSKGRVRLEPDPVRFVRSQIAAVGFREAQLTHEVAIRSRTMPFRHEDPADRFLAATAAVYDLTLVTADRRLLGMKELSLLANR